MPSAFADRIDVPVASAKIPVVSTCNGPWAFDAHRCDWSFFIEAPIAATFLALAGSKISPPLLPGATNASDQGNSLPHASKSAERAVYSAELSPQESEWITAPLMAASCNNKSTSGTTHPSLETISWKMRELPWASEDPVVGRVPFL